MNIKAILTAAALVSAMPVAAQTTTCHQFGAIVQCNTVPAYGALQPQRVDPMTQFMMMNQQLEQDQIRSNLLRLQLEEARRRCRASGSWNCN